jgi:hypothetical protein
MRAVSVDVLLICAAPLWARRFKHRNVRSARPAGKKRFDYLTTAYEDHYVLSMTKD